MSTDSLASRTRSRAAMGGNGGTLLRPVRTADSDSFVSDIQSSSSLSATTAESRAGGEGAYAEPDERQRLGFRNRRDFIDDSRVEVGNVKGVRRGHNADGLIDAVLAMLGEMEEIPGREVVVAYCVLFVRGSGHPTLPRKAEEDAVVEAIRKTGGSKRHLRHTLALRAERRAIRNRLKREQR